MIGVFLLKGIILGLAIAMPVGPIGMLCIKKTLHDGRLSGLFSGLGAAAADTFYGIVAVFGITLVSDFFITYQFWFRLLGGIVLILLGARTLFTPPPQTIPDGLSTKKNLLKDFFTTFFLTLTNPLTILAYVAIFTALGIFNIQEHLADAFFLVLGIFSGSAIWWLVLSEGITFLKRRMSQKIVSWSSRISGLIIGGFGIAALISLLF